MFWRCVCFFCLLGILTAGGVTNVGAQDGDSLTVFAASSLTDAVGEIAKIFEKDSGTRVYVNFAASNTLRLQIEKGAPCDMFLSADAGNVDKLSGLGLTAPEDQAVILTNRLIVVGQSGEAGKLSGLSDLTLGEGEWLSLADPQTVPAGIYAKEALTAAGIWEKLKVHVAPALNVRAALAQVKNGNARYGIVYKTDVTPSDHIQVLYEIPVELHAPIVYKAAVIRGSLNSETARSFMAFLKSPAAKDIFQKYGFEPYAP